MCYINEFQTDQTHTYFLKIKIYQNTKTFKNKVYEK